MKIKEMNARDECHIKECSFVNDAFKNVQERQKKRGEGHDQRMFKKAQVF